MKRSGFKRPAWTPAPVSAPAPITRGVVVSAAGMGTVVKKSPRAVNQAVLDMARGRPCLIRSPICVGGTESTVACHGAGVANGKGMGYKVGDHLTCWGCWACNDYTDAHGKATGEEKTAAFDAGYVVQVLEWQRIVGDMSETPKNRRAAHWALMQLQPEELTC